MLTHAELDLIALAVPEGNKRMIKITVKYLGGTKGENSNYKFSFKGPNVTKEGAIMCLGPSGDTPATKKHRFVLRLKLIAADTIDKVSFKHPDPAVPVEFIVGQSLNEECPTSPMVGPNNEFENIVVEPDDMLTFINRKKNSETPLGYKFKVWITHWNGELHGIECDPRIINK